MENSENRIAIYSRKSRFTGKGESIGNQTELCKAYIRVHYGDDAAENAIIYEDEGFSGGDLNRPDFKKMMDAAKERRFHVIIVYRLDRISRNISDFSSLIETLSRLGIAFISIREQFDTGTPMGRAMMYIASVFSQLERETIAERIRDNMHELAKTGRWLGGITPTGYASESVKTVTVDGKARKACRLKLLPDEAELVKTIYDVFLETDSLTTTEAELMRRGLMTKNGKHFTRFSIKAILQNPVYLIADEDAYNFFVDQKTDLFSDHGDFDGVHGILAYNRTDQAKGRAAINLPIAEWIVSVGQHPGLIPGAVWVRIQQSLERNKSKAFRKPRGNEALLTGLLYCSCGSRMYPKLSKRRTADGSPVYTYQCKMKERSQRGLCDGRNVNGNALDAVVVAQIKKLRHDAGTFMAQLEQYKRYYRGEREDGEKKLNALRQEKANLVKKIEALVDSLTELRDGVARSHVAKRIERLNQECGQLDDKISSLEHLSAQNALSGERFDFLRRQLSRFDACMEEMSVQQKRSAISAIVRKVIWDGTYAHMVLFGTPDDEVGCPDECSGTAGMGMMPWGEDSK